MKATCSLVPASLALPLPDVMEVEVGTYTQQHDGRQHKVDQIPEFGLQVALPVPEYLQDREQTFKGSLL